jgi:seryl-tRNA synthetase
VYLHGGALLEMELVRWVMHKVAGKGFTAMITPDLVRTGVVDACGFQARGEHSQVVACTAPMPVLA